MLAKLDHPVTFLILNSMATFAMILLFIYLLVRFAGVNPIDVAARKA